MKNRLQWLMRALMLTMVALLLAAFETSTLAQIFGTLSPPSLWINVLLYTALTRSRNTAMAVAYMISLFLTPITVLPLGVFASSSVLTVLVAQYFKSRIYWPTLTYTMLIGGLGCLAYNILSATVYWVFVRQPMGVPSFSDWAMQSMLTPLVAPIIFTGLRIIDAWMKVEPAEMGDSEL